MKPSYTRIGIMLVRSSILAVAMALLQLSALRAAQTKTEKPKPYPLQTCIVSGEKLGGSMGKPYVFTYQGREIKLCCQGCLNQFNKEPAKYLKKIEESEKAGPKSVNAPGKAHQGAGEHRR